MQWMCVCVCIQTICTQNSFAKLVLKIDGYLIISNIIYIQIIHMIYRSLRNGLFFLSMLKLFLISFFN